MSCVNRRGHTDRCLCVEGGKGRRGGWEGLEGWRCLVCGGWEGWEGSHGFLSSDRMGLVDNTLTASLSF